VTKVDFRRENGWGLNVNRNEESKVGIGKGTPTDQKKGCGEIGRRGKKRGSIKFWVPLE